MVVFELYIPCHPLFVDLYIMKKKKDFIVRAFSSKNANILAFDISKSYFIYFNIPLYNTLNIKSFIFFTILLKYYLFIIV